MPLLEPDTEFAGKWSNLCDAHLDEGIHTPIIAYEFLNKFYVQEGNKRVSVLKYFDAVRIAGTVTRLVPERNDSLENRIYYEFLDFYKLSKVNDVHFSRLGGYAKLQTLVCKASGESWTDDDRLSFSSFYTMFRQQFLALGGGGLNLTAGDAMLVYLSVYRYADACESTPSQMKQNLEKLWDEVKVLTEPQAVALSLEPKQGPGEPLLAKLNIFTKPSELKVVFLHEHNAESSAWVRAHDKGIEALQQAFPDRVFITRKENIEPEVDAEQVLEDVAHDNADVVFTSSARMHTACLKVAAQHPKTRILNCSLNAPHPLVRTYYPRTYEVTYLLGMLAGVMARTDRVGYVAANPVYGIPAAVNAYAQGLKTVRPDAKVVLRWACLPDPAHPLDFSDRPDVEIFYARDNREPEGTHRDYGLVHRMPDGSLQPLGLPVWRWDTFYIEIVRSIFDGAWDSDAAGARAVNYWWGMRSGAEEIDYSKDLPAGTLQLLDLMEKMLHEDDLRIFPEDLYAQGHVLHSPEAVVYSPKELMEMDWLDECVEGALPHYDELDVKTHVLMAINGLNTLKGFVK
jgi:basic membrane lipoprotein Med (substrate-binding protein (PBP1-ABC) superfamily)